MAFSAPDAAGRGRPTRDVRARPERRLEDDGLAVPLPDGLAGRVVAGPRTPPPATAGSAGGDAAEDMKDSTFRDPWYSVAPTFARIAFAESRRNVAHHGERSETNTKRLQKCL
jgi:hypothetical protein